MKNITPKEAKELILSGAVQVLDVRAPYEFQEGHIAGAQNIDVSNATFDECIKALDRNATYLVNCRSGARSSRAVSIMNELGFSNVMNLEGGILAWEREGCVVEK